ncbi:MAG: SIMPL domain-containing protein [Bryobacterales bacterium]|jgi:hypothetical protein|nr:SIMPL domain-containing protein [Bryobacterales bacterium]
MSVKSLWKQVAMVATLSLFAAWAVGQTVESTPTGTRISASSESVVQVKPNQAQISMAVVTQAANAQEAGSRNSQETERLLGALKQALGTGGEFKTSGYWVNPQYANPREGNRATQFLARNSVEVTISDLAIISKVIDAATRAGANNVSALRFSVKDEEAAKTSALVQATASAREKAGAMAKALGLRVRRVVSVTDTEAPAVMPLMMEARSAMADAGSAQTPVEPGMIEVRARVTVTVEAN